MVRRQALPDFRVHICSAGGCDFVRPVSEQLYGIPRERVMGSATTLDFEEWRTICTEGSSVS